MALEKIKIPTYALLYKLLQTGFDGGQPAIRAPSDLNDTEEVITEVVNGIVDYLNAAQVAAIQATWFVDSVNGSDANVGDTSGNPLKTFQEIVRRWGPNPVLKQTTTVTILSTTLAAGDRIAFEGVTTPSVLNLLIIRGTRFNAASQLGGGGAITAVTPISHAAADGALYVTVGAQDWSTFVGKPCRITGGARDGAIGFVAKANVAAGKARFSPFTLVTPGTQGQISSTSLVTPQVGDVLTVLNFTNTNAAPLSVVGGSMSTIFEQIDFQDDPATTGQQFYSDNDNAPTFNNCILEEVLFLAGSMFPISFNGCMIPATLGAGPQVAVCACLVNGSMTNTYAAIGLDTLFQGCRFISTSIGAMSIIGDCGIYDNGINSTAAVTAADGGRISLQAGFVGESANGTIYGTGNAGFAFIVGRMGQIQYKATGNIQITGTTSLIKFSGVNKALVDLPLVLDTHLNAMVASAG